LYFSAISVFLAPKLLIFLRSSTAVRFLRKSCSLFSFFELHFAKLRSGPTSGAVLFLIRLGSVSYIRCTIVLSRVLSCVLLCIIVYYRVLSYNHIFCVLCMYYTVTVL